MVTSVLTLGLATWAIGIGILVFLVICCLPLILIILIQRPQGGGLSGAFGAGGGSGQTAFGAKTGDALTIATVILFALFLVGAVALNFAVRPSEARPPADQTSSEQAPSTTDGDAGEVPAETPAETTSDEATPPSDAPATDTPPVEAPPAEGATEGGGR